MNKASGGDGIPVELFQILKDDAVKSAALNMPANLENPAVVTGLENVKFSFQSLRAMPKNVQSSIVLFSYISKVMLKILQARLHQYVN